jgi:hypothetical protein
VLLMLLMLKELPPVVLLLQDLLACKTKCNVIDVGV